ncbi:MAG TPA: PH domain-containing protein [Tepidiformaceae bacterium]
MKLPFQLQTGEKVLVFTRRHWVSIVPRLVADVLALIVPIVLVTWLGSATTGLGGTAGKVVAGLSLVWAAGLIVRGYFDWYRFHNDIWVVTNQRVIDSVKRNWFNHTMSSADLIDIQDISIQRSGFLATVLKFGDVRCQTAGEQPHFIFAGISNPGKMLELVDSTRDEARKGLMRIPGKP